MRWFRADALGSALRSVIALFDGEVLAVDHDGRGHDIPVGDRTTGHRFLAFKPFAVADFADYSKSYFKPRLFWMPPSGVRSCVAPGRSRKRRDFR